MMRTQNQVTGLLVFLAVSGAGYGQTVVIPDDPLLDFTVNSTVGGTIVAAALADRVGQLTQHGITWTFAEEVESGLFANGDLWVLGPATLVDNGFSGKPEHVSCVAARRGEHAPRQLGARLPQPEAAV